MSVEDFDTFKGDAEDSAMNFLKKLFKPAPARDSIERAPRIRINELHDLEFTAASGSFKLDNISATGVGLIGTGEAPLVGELRIADQTYKLELQVIYSTGQRVGARIKMAPSPFVAALQKYFETEIAALKLKAVREEYLKPSPVGRPYWFQGDNNCDVSYIADGANVLSFAITFFGNSIEGSSEHALRYASISESKTGRIKGAEILDQKGAPDQLMKSVAQRVVNAVEGLEPAHRAAILSFLS